MVAITLFIGPAQGGLEPDMSKWRSVPVFSMRMSMVSGSSTTPSESTQARPW